MIPEHVLDGLPELKPTGGELSVLNCGAGDMKFTFDKDDPLETARAARVVTDMLARGYSLFLQDENGKYVPVKRFDATTNCYVIADGAAVAPTPENAVGGEPAATEQAGVKTGGKRGKYKKPEKSVPLQKSRVTGVAPTAGG